MFFLVKGILKKNVRPMRNIYINMRKMPKISHEKVERMRKMILECFSAKYFSSPGS
jgi:hypothetical protein